jgi:hypothetical protein
VLFVVAVEVLVVVASGFELLVVGAGLLKVVSDPGMILSPAVLHPLRECKCFVWKYFFVGERGFLLVHTEKECYMQSQERFEFSDDGKCFHW